MAGHFESKQRAIRELAATPTGDLVDRVGYGRRVALKWLKLQLDPPLRGGVPARPATPVARELL
jgi:hypothetical protein